MNRVETQENRLESESLLVDSEWELGRSPHPFLPGYFIRHIGCDVRMWATAYCIVCKKHIPEHLRALRNLLAIKERM